MPEITIDSFLDSWPESPSTCKQVFVELRHYLERFDETTIEFHARPGVTYSLRGLHRQSVRPLYVLIDVIEDEPRWLSVCFYADSIDDPEGLGNTVPGGLLDEDGYCFDVERYSEPLLAYLKERIHHAHAVHASA